MRAVTTRYAALLRGINVGKARPMAMPQLTECLAASGFDDVRTHLRSGNVVLTSPLGEADLVAAVRAAIEKEFGFAVPVVVRSGAELAAVLAADPLGDVVTDPARPHPYGTAPHPRCPGDEVADRTCDGTRRGHASGSPGSRDQAPPRVMPRNRMSKYPTAAAGSRICLAHQKVPGSRSASTRS